MDIRSTSVGPWPMNTYVAICPMTRASVLIDPGADPETLTGLLADTTPVAILLTHTHPDHIGAVEAMRQQLNLPVYAHVGPHFRDVAQDNILKEGDMFTVGNETIQVYETPGHTHDMLSFAMNGGNDIIVGDTIFEGGPGRTWSADDFRETLDTLRRVVLTWPTEATCYPGHGPAFRLGEIRARIQDFVVKDHGDFYGDAEW